MYRGIGTGSGLDVVSQVPYEVGKWTHVAVVYDPVDPVTNASLIIYINGIPANTNVWTGGGTGTDPGYVANAADSDVAMSLAEKVVEIKQFAEPVANEHRFGFGGDEPCNVLFQQHLMFFN